MQKSLQETSIGVRGGDQPEPLSHRLRSLQQQVVAAEALLDARQRLDAAAIQEMRGLVERISEIASAVLDQPVGEIDNRQIVELVGRAARVARRVCSS